MSQTIDSKVVEMRFDNQNFERNVAQSMNTIQGLQKTLDFSETESSVTTNLHKISQSANNVDLSGLYQAIDTINYRFSTLGVIATNIINTISTEITTKLVSAFNLTFGQIKSGGLSRAMNLEKAQFQLENLLNDEKEVAAVMKNVNDAVNGTAYGLDAAAVVASQLTASGAKAGDELYNQLRAIAGVASMTSSSYEDIGQIFTTVAGNGKLMSMQLMQLSTKGLNVAAIMSKQMGVTEAKFREMVTQGKISYQQFADAMVEAFGEAAGKANETFDGALSNVKAALSRIGAKFYSPGLIQARDILNELRLAINAISTALDPLIDTLNDFVYVLSKRIQDNLKWFTGQLKNFPEDNSFNTFLKNANSGLRTLSELMVGKKLFINADQWAFFEEAGIVSDTFVKSIKEAAKEYDIDVDKMIESSGDLKSTLEKDWLTTEVIDKAMDKFGVSSDLFVRDLSKIEEATGKTFNETTLDDIKQFYRYSNELENSISLYDKISKTATDSGKSLTDVLNDLNKAELETNKQTLLAAGYTEDQIKEMRELYSEFKNGTNILSGVYDSVSMLGDVNNEYKGFLTDLSDSLVWIGRSLGLIFSSAIEGFRLLNSDMSETKSIFEIISSAIYKASSALYMWLSNEEHADDLRRTFAGVFAIFDIGKQIIEGLLIPIKALLAQFGLISGGALDVTATLGDLLVHIANLLRDSQIFIKIGNVLASVINVVSSNLKYLWSIFKTAFIANKDVLKGFYEVFVTLFNSIVSCFSGTSGAIDEFSNKLEEFFNKIKLDEKTLESIRDKLLEIKDSLINAFRFGGHEILKGGLIASFVVVATKIFYFFKNIQWDIERVLRLTKSIPAFLEHGLKAFDSLAEMLNTVRGVLLQYQNSLKADYFLKLAIAVGILSVSLLLLSHLDTKQIITIGTALIFFTICLEHMMDVFDRMTRTDIGETSKLKDVFKDFSKVGIEATKMSAIGTAILKFAAAIAILAIAVKIISEAVSDDPSAAFIGFIMVLILMKAMSEIMIELSEKAIKTVGAAKAFTKMAVSIILLSLAIKIIKDCVSDDPMATLSSFILVLGMLAAMTVSMIALSQLAKGATFTSVAMIAMATSMLIMAQVIKSLTSIMKGDASNEYMNVANAFILLIGMMMTMVLSMVVLSKLAPLASLASVGVIAMSVAMLIMTEVMSKLTKMLDKNPKSSWAALGYMAVMLTEFLAACILMQAGIAGAAAMLVLASALSILIPLLILVGQIPTETIINGLKNMFIALGGMSLMSVLFATMSPLIMAFAISLTLLGVALTLCAVSLTMFVSAFSMLSTIAEISSETISIAMQNIAKSITELIVNILDQASLVIGKLLTVVVENSPKILQIMGTLVGLLCDAIVQNLPRLIDTAFFALTTLIQKIIDNIPIIIGLAVDIIDAFIRGIADNISKIVDAGIYLLEKFLEGIDDAIVGVVDTAFNTVIHFINALADTIRDKKKELKDAGQNLIDAIFGDFTEDNDDFVDSGKNAIKGLIKGLANKTLIGQLGTQAASLGKVILDKVNKKLDEHSPSKETEKTGVYAVMGLINGLKRTAGLGEASESLGSIILDRMNGALEEIDNYMNSDYEFSPVITPVVDMGNVNGTAREINSLLSGKSSFGMAATINANMSRIQNDPYSDITSAINMLHNDLNGISANNYTINGITYDDGSNVANAVSDLVRATRMERRA